MRTTLLVFLLLFPISSFAFDCYQTEGVVKGVKNPKEVALAVSCKKSGDVVINSGFHSKNPNLSLSSQTPLLDQKTKLPFGIQWGFSGKRQRAEAFFVSGTLICCSPILEKKIL